MLGLLELVRKQPSKMKPQNKDITEKFPASYAQVVKGYNPEVDYPCASADYTEIKATNAGYSESLYKDKDDICDLLGLEAVDTDDSGCHCPEDDEIFHDTQNNDKSDDFENSQPHYPNLIENSCVQSSDDDKDGSESIYNLVGTNQDLRVVHMEGNDNDDNDDDYNDDEDDDEDDDDEEEEEEEEEEEDDNEENYSTDEDSQSEGKLHNNSDLNKSQSSIKTGSLSFKKDDPNDRDYEENVSDDDEEGGWISEADEKTADESESDDEMFDLFGDNTIIDYDEIDRQILSYPPKSSSPAIPTRTYKSRVMPSKTNIYHRQMAVKGGRRSKDQSCKDDENDAMYAMMAISRKAPSVKKGRYAFPRADPEDISDITDFWETDFQVDKSIIPRMSLWEKLGICPKRNENSEDFELYNSYKNLYSKWVHCHNSKEQWYRKYGWSSLDNVLYVKRKQTKRYPEECEPIPGLQEKLEVFESFYSCLAMENISPKSSSPTKCSEFTFTRSVSSDSKLSNSDIRQVSGTTFLPVNK